MAAKKLTLILAEDNPGDVFLIRRGLDQAGLSYELLVAKDGREALNYVQEAAAGTRAIDLVLLDLNLPKYDGSEVLAAIRSQPLLAAIPAVVLTSSNSPQERERCLSLGANRYFEKPSNLAGFMEIGKIAKELVETDESE